MPIGPPTANPYYDDFAAQQGMDPSLAEKWKQMIAPPGGVIDRAREMASKYVDPAAAGLQRAGELAGKVPLMPGLQAQQLALMGAGAAAPRIADALRPPPKDEASTPAFTRPEEPGTPYKAPPTQTWGGGAPTIAAGPPGITSTKESELTTTHKGKPVSDAVRQYAEDAHVAGRLANQYGLEAAQEKGQAEGMAAAIQANAMQAFQAHESKEQQRKNELLRGQVDQLQRDTEAVRSGAVNPNKYLDEMGIGSKIAGLIGMALGGAVAAKTGGPNPVAQLLERQIQNSISAQEANLSNKRTAAAGQQNLIDQMTRQYDSEAKGRLAAHITLLEGVRTQLQAATANVTNKAALAHATEVDGALAEKQAKLQNEFEKQAADDVTVQTQDVFMTKTGGKAGGGAGAGGGGAGGLGKHGDAMTKELSENLTKSGIPQARSQLDAIDRALAGVKGNEIPGVGGIHKYAQLLGGSAEKLDNIGYSLFGSEKGQEIRQAVQNLENGILKDQSGAAVSDQELMRFKAAMAGARDAASFKRGLEGYRNRIAQLEATVRSGFAPEINQVQQGRAAAYAGGAGGGGAPTPVNPIR